MAARVFALFLTVFTLTSAVVNADDESAAWKEFPSPNGLYAIRLREGFAIGNCRYNQAELVERKTGKQLFDFDPMKDTTDGGYEDRSVVWSPGSSAGALYKHCHRSGAPLVVMIADGTVKPCSMPEINLPHNDKPANDGRWVQDWVTPKKWASEKVLVLSDSGLIQQQKGVAAWIRYDYALKIAFDENGGGVLKSLKCTDFDKDKAWLRQRK